MTRPGLTTTLAEIYAQHPCRDGWGKLVRHVGQYGADTPLALLTILESNGIDDTLWVLNHVSVVGGAAVLAAFACDCAEHVLPIYERYVPGDSRLRRAIEAKRRWLAGNLSDDEIAAIVQAETVEKEAWPQDHFCGAAAVAAWVSVAVARAVGGPLVPAVRHAARIAVKASVGKEDDRAYDDAEQQWQVNRLRELLGTCQLYEGSSEQ